jgi:hypothetical protein
LPLALVFGLGLGALPLSCGSDKVRSPFGPGAGGAGGEVGDPGSAGFRLDIDAGEEELDPTLGGPCEDDGQCADKIDCTEDRCDQELGRCRFMPNDSRCEDARYCDGVQRCDVRMGCRGGEVVACSDNDTCTIDVCEDETRSCRHEPRDADGDGDPVRSCGGGDCDDDDPRVNGSVSEVCGNSRDDDCDGEVDEADCSAPENDNCDAALVVADSGYYDLDFTATALDYPSGCASSDASFRDVVVSVAVPEGGPWDLDVTGRVDAGKLALSSGPRCGNVAKDCAKSFEVPAGGSSARLLLRDVPEGARPLYVAVDSETTAQLRVELRPAEPQLGETCEAAVPLPTTGEPVSFRLPSYRADVATQCLKSTPGTGDAFVSFSLDAPRDVTLIAEAKSDLGLPVLSLLDDRCAEERTCRRSQPGRLFERALPAGDYRVLVAATGPDDVSVRLQTEPPSEPPPGEGCDNPLPLALGVEQISDLSEHEDAVNLGCLAGAPDATFEFTLAGSRDVLLVGRFSDGDTGSVAFATDTCDDNRGCSDGVATERAVRYGVPKGTHRAVAESARGNPVGVSYLERPSASPVLVPFAENCDAPVSIPEWGGRFSGNTSNAFPDFSAGCDVGGQPEGGAPDQLLKLSLSAPRRVILDMRGSAYQTLLSVRQGELCPGSELPLACAPGYWSSRSFLDLELQAGDYFVQIDGYNGESGAWRLEVFTAPL